jgi:hypothetical protein
MAVFGQLTSLPMANEIRMARARPPKGKYVRTGTDMANSKVNCGRLMKAQSDIFQIHPERQVQHGQHEQKSDPVRSTWVVNFNLGLDELSIGQTNSS